MKVFTCTDHDVHYPVGGASVVVAESEVQAYVLLRDALKRRRLKDDKFTLQELDTEVLSVHILCDGEY